MSNIAKEVNIMAELNEVLVRELLTVCKTIYNDIEYKEIGNNHYGFKILIDLSMPQQLEFNSTLNLLTSGYKFALIYAGQRIAGMCAKGRGMRHHNPTCDNICGPHFHIWSLAYGDKIAESLDIKGIDHPSMGIKWFMRKYNIYPVGDIFFPGSYQLEVKCYDELSRLRVDRYS